MTVTIENLYTGNGSTTDYSFTFPYLDTTDIKVTLATVATTAYSLLNATTVRFDSAPGNGVAIRIYRETAFDTPKATFYPGSAIRANDLNDNTLQNLYVNQESNDKVADAWLTGDPTVISTESWYTTDDTKIASTKAIEGRIDAKIDTALTGDVAAGNKITITDNSPSSGQITVALTSGSLVNSDVNASAAIAGTKISPSFGSQNVSTSGTLASGSATVTGNIAVSGTVDGRDVAADGTKLDGIESGATADQSNAEIRTAVEAATDSNVFTDADHTKLNAIEDNATRDQTAAEIRTLVESASDSNVFTDADHSKLNAIEASATADQTASEIRTLVEAASDSNVFTDADHTKLNAIEANATADQTDAEIRAAVEAATDSNVFTDADHSKLNAIEANATADQTASEIKTLLQSDKLTSSEIATGALDGRYYTETESDARYFNISTGDTIKDGDTFPDNDTTIATTAAINDRIIDLVEEVGGFVPIANETSFPNANPDVNNGAGTLVSIKALSSNLTSNGSGVATISNGTVGNSTVTINGLANSTTYAANFGMIVETTTTLNTYTFHRQVPIATEVSTVAGSISNVNTVAGNISNVNTVAGNNSNVTTVAGANSNITAVAGSISNVNTVATNISNVNDFSDKYRVASSAPTSSLDTGDLYFDTTANELKVYNGSAWQGGVTATGNLAGLGANTFTGNQALSGAENGGAQLRIGASNDMQFEHDGSNSYFTNSTGNLGIQSDTLHLQAKTGGEYYIKAVKDGAVELYYDNSKKFETTSGGAKVTGSLNTTSYIYIDNNEDLWLEDNGKIRIGNGDDIQIYHNGTDSYLTNATNDLYIKSTGDDIWIQAADNIMLQAQGSEHGIIVYGDGEVELYYDGSSKFATKSYGAFINGHLQMDDNSTIKLGNSLDLQLYHDGSHSRIYNSTGSLVLRTDNDVFIQSYTGGENIIKGTANGAVELYHDNTLKFITGTDGTYGSVECKTGKNAWDGYSIGGYYVFMSNNQGAGDTCGIYNDLDNEWMFKGTRNAASHLYYDGSSKLETHTNGANVTGRLWATGNAGYGILVDDDVKLGIGTGKDLQLYHDGSNSYLTNSTGALFIKNTSGSDLDVFSNGSTRLRVNAGEMAVDCSHNSSVDLYYDNVKRFWTTSTGSAIAGTLSLTGDIQGTQDNLKVLLGGANDLQIYHDGSHNHIRHGVANQNLYIEGVDNESGTPFIYLNPRRNQTGLSVKANQGVDLYYDNVKRLETTSTGVTVTGTVSDSIGDLRKIPANATTSAYTLSSSDVGKAVTNTSGGVTVPNGVFTGGSAVTIINHSGSDITITQASGLTLYNAADAATGNRTLAARGMATVWFQASSVAYISGAGLS